VINLIFVERWLKLDRISAVLVICAGNAMGIAAMPLNNWV